MHFGLHSRALLVLVALAACQEPPSFRARWSVVDREGVERTTTAPLQCTSLGINTVRVRVIDELGVIADDAYHPCFAAGFDDPDKTVSGPALDAGRYAIEVRGVQRNLEPWKVALADDDELSECNLGDVECDPRDIACDCGEFEARGDHTERLVDFVIRSPPDECVDGIDNDADGLLDANDPSCGLGAIPGSEGEPVSKIQFRILLGLLGGNDVATCGGVGLIDLRARVCPRAAGDAPAACPADTPDAAILACRAGEPTFFEQTLPQDDYTLEVVGRDAQGMVRTIAALFPVTVSAGAGAFVPIDLDFGATDFDPAIEARAGLIVEYADEASADGTRSCAPPTGTGGVTIDNVILEVRDAHGGVLDSPVALSDSTVLDGVTAITCPNGALLTEILTWGGYSLRAQARAADGTVCFSTDGAGPNGADAPLVLVPDTIGVVIPRVLDASGAPPPSCE